MQLHLVQAHVSNDVRYSVGGGGSDAEKEKQCIGGGEGGGASQRELG